jgi:hypothetical protein
MAGGPPAWLNGSTRGGPGACSALEANRHAGVGRDEASWEMLSDPDGRARTDRLLKEAKAAVKEQLELHRPLVEWPIRARPGRFTPEVS